MDLLITSFLYDSAEVFSEFVESSRRASIYEMSVSCRIQLLEVCVRSAMLPRKFDLRIFQRDSFDLPSVSGDADWRPTLRDFQQESEDFPSLKNLQSLDSDEFPSLKSIQSLETDEDAEESALENETESRESKENVSTEEEPKLNCRESTSDANGKNFLTKIPEIDAIQSKEMDGEQEKEITAVSDNEEPFMQRMMFNNFTQISPQRKMKSRLALQERFTNLKC